MGQSDQRFPLGSEELQRFHRDGYIGPFDLYDPGEMEAQLRALRPKLLSTKNAIYSSAKSAFGEMGCLQFIPGSHKTMKYDESKVMTYDADRINNVTKEGVKRGFFGYDCRQLQKDPDWSPDESLAVSMVMRQGQFVIFWSTLMHASHPHTAPTNQMRLGYAGRYLPTSVRVYPYSDSLEEFGGSASLERFGNVLVAGEDEFHHIGTVPSAAEH